MAIVLNGTTGITNDGGYTGDGVVFADTTPANTLVTTTGGNVGIGTATAPAKLTVGALGVFRVQTGSTTMDCTPTPGATDGFVWNTSASSYYDWAISGSTKVRIDSSGNLLVGTTAAALSPVSNGFALQLYNGYSTLSIGHANGTGSGAQYANFAYSGGATGSITQNGITGVLYNTSSDYRLKHDIQPMTGALAKVAALKPCTYKWNADNSDGEGFIAHELQAVVPECVTGEKDAVDAEGKPIYQGIDTSFLVATLTAAIQEQQAIITAQAAQIQQLREKVLEVEEGTSNMLVENTNNLYETITALTARVAALEGK